MANSTDQVQLKQLVFELAWETRDEIICNLNQHTKLLSGLTIKPEAREKLRKANGDLIVVLLNLPLKVDDSKSRRDAPKNELLLDLNWETRSRIVDTLMANHQIALLESNSVVGQFKSKLIHQNNDLSCELLKLISRSISNGMLLDSSRQFITFLISLLNKFDSPINKLSVTNQSNLSR